MNTGKSGNITSLSILSLRYLIFALGIMTIVRCGKSDEVSPSTQLPEKYESYWYYSYEADRILTASDLSLENLTPYTLANMGDTLFVANNADKSLIVFDTEKGKILKTLSAWKFKGTDVQKKFDDNIEAIVPAGDRLYVTDKASRIYCFALPSFECIGCIGNGQYWNAVFQSQAAAVAEGLVFSRDKDGTVSLYEEDRIEMNFENVPRYRRSKAVGAVNNNFATHSMRQDGLGHMLLTDYNQKKIHLLDIQTAKMMEDNTSIDKPEAAIAADFNPTGIAVTEERYYVTGGNRIHIYDRASGTWGKSLRSVNGYSFSEPRCITEQSDSVLWVSDIHKDKLSLVRLNVRKNEIREYERSGANILKVSEPSTRGVSREFFVDILTHEIIGEHHSQH